jgi:hypothetical protein
MDDPRRLTRFWDGARIHQGGDGVCIRTRVGHRGRQRAKGVLRCLLPTRMPKGKPLPSALSTSILLDEQLNRRPMTVKFVSGSCRQFLCETASRLDVTTSIPMLKGLTIEPYVNLSATEFEPCAVYLAINAAYNNRYVHVLVEQVSHHSITLPNHPHG